MFPNIFIQNSWCNLFSSSFLLKIYSLTLEASCSSVETAIFSDVAVFYFATADNSLTVELNSWIPAEICCTVAEMPSNCTEAFLYFPKLYWISGLFLVRYRDSTLYVLCSLFHHLNSIFCIFLYAKDQFSNLLRFFL